MGNHISAHIWRYIAKNWPAESIARLKRELEKNKPSARLKEPIKNDR